MKGDIPPGTFTDRAVGGRKTPPPPACTDVKSGKFPPTTGVGEGPWEVRDEPTEGGTEEERAMLSNTDNEPLTTERTRVTLRSELSYQMNFDTSSTIDNPLILRISEKYSAINKIMRIIF
jgi:hypothetical protein